MVSCQRGGNCHKRSKRAGTAIFVAAGFFFVARHASFVHGPYGDARIPSRRPRPQCATRTAVPEQPEVAAKQQQQQQQEGHAGKTGSSAENLDDAVLEAAMAMTQKEEAAFDAVALDIQNIFSVFLISTIVYSLGSSIVAFSTDRVQDRTGGDFTFYDFLDNCFNFADFNLVYWLGFDPQKLIMGGSSTSSGAA
mmetsp:Transcript_54240/g.108020  ORF Transcript_54240/g.108020 Transcript_54240/m.108020 type:complete len:194 (-) Transcript_54240:168-749(-)